MTLCPTPGLFLNGHQKDFLEMTLVPLPGRRAEEYIPNPLLQPFTLETNHFAWLISDQQTEHGHSLTLHNSLDA